MKLILVNSLHYGGLERNVYDLVTNYPEKIIVVCISSVGEIGKKLISKGHKVLLLNSNKLGNIKKLKRIIRKHKINTIISQNAAPMQLSVLSSFFSRVKRIHVDHNSFAEGVSFKERLENILFSKFIDKFVTITPKVKKKMISSWLVPARKIRVIINGIDIKKIKKNSKLESKDAKKFIDFKGKKIGLFGSLRTVKDHITALKAFKEVVNQRTKDDIKLIFVGDGPQRKKIESERNRIELNNKVLITGMRKDYLGFMNECDVILCSSLDEGISIALLEGMALGKPLIVTNTGGNPLLVKNNENGMLFEIKDHDKLSKILNKVLNDDFLIKKMGKKSKEFSNKYSVKRMIEEYREVIE